MDHLPHRTVQQSSEIRTEDQSFPDSQSETRHKEHWQTIWRRCLEHGVQQSCSPLTRSGSSPACTTVAPPDNQLFPSSPCAAELSHALDIVAHEVVLYQDSLAPRTSVGVRIARALQVAARGGGERARLNAAPVDEQRQQRLAVEGVDDVGGGAGDAEQRGRQVDERRRRLQLRKRRNARAPDEKWDASVPVVHLRKGPQSSGTQIRRLAELATDPSKGTMQMHAGSIEANLSQSLLSFFVVPLGKKTKRSFGPSPKTKMAGIAHVSFVHKHVELAEAEAVIGGEEEKGALEAARACASAKHCLHHVVHRQQRAPAVAVHTANHVCACVRQHRLRRDGRVVLGTRRRARVPAADWPRLVRGPVGRPRTCVPRRGYERLVYRLGRHVGKERRARAATQRYRVDPAGGEVANDRRRVVFIGSHPRAVGDAGELHARRIKLRRDI
eukprot:817162-Pleurochrysis_carterae.AAC.2